MLKVKNTNAVRHVQRVKMAALTIFGLGGGMLIANLMSQIDTAPYLTSYGLMFLFLSLGFFGLFLSRILKPLTDISMRMAADTSEMVAQFKANVSEIDEQITETKKQLEVKKQLADKDARIAELEKELAAAKGINDTPICDGKGLSAVVCRMRREGKNEKEIAQYLSDKGQGCSNPQIGALIHPTAEIGITTSDAITKYAQRLLDKA